MNRLYALTDKETNQPRRIMLSIIWKQNNRGITSIKQLKTINEIGYIFLNNFQRRYLANQRSNWVYKH